ncbi:MAG: DinB family protein [Dehalococcoidia bacterium]
MPISDSELNAILQQLGEAVSRVEALIREVPDNRWDDIVHTGEGAWTRRELLAHMAANDLRQLVRVRIGAGIAEPDDPATHEQELDVHVWNRARVAERAGSETAQLIEEMRQNREKLLRLLGGLTSEQRDRPMPFRGVPTPLADMIPTLIGHLDSHAQELVSGL